MVSGLLKISIAPLPSVYLGVPPFFGCTRHSHFSHMMGSIRSRLAGWKTKCLSFAGRLTLVRHVLASIPPHIALVLPLPSKTCLHIEWLTRKFLWSASPDKLKSNLVRWELVCLLKSEGGLGLHRVKEFNEACLRFLAWFVINADSPWAIWFKERFHREPTF